LKSLDGIARFVFSCAMARILWLVFGKGGLRLTSNTSEATEPDG
jgi:hypothetical protein